MYQLEEMNLTELPPELLLTVFLHLKTKFLLHTVASVCKLFYNLLTPEATWKSRFGKIWPKRAKDNESDCIYPRYL